MNIIYKSLKQSAAENSSIISPVSYGPLFTSSFSSHSFHPFNYFKNSVIGIREMEMMRIQERRNRQIVSGREGGKGLIGFLSIFI